MKEKYIRSSSERPLWWLLPKAVSLSLRLSPSLSVFSPSSLRLLPVFSPSLKNTALLPLESKTLGVVVRACGPAAPRAVLSEIQEMEQQLKLKIV
jgi:hypothetical protein